MLRMRLEDISGARFATTVGLSFITLCALASLHQYLVIYGIGFMGKAFGNAVLLLIAAIPAVIYASAIALALIATRAFADRLRTLNFPIAIAAGALFAMMGAALTLKSLEIGSINSRLSKASAPIVLQIIFSSMTYVAGLTGALSIARPVQDWKKHKPSLILIGLMTYVLLESFVLYNVRLTGIAWYPLANYASGFLRSFGLSMSFVWAAAFIGLAIWQRRSATARKGDGSAPMEFGRALAASVVLGSAILIAATILANPSQLGPANDFMLISLIIPSLIATSGWIYIAPLFAGILAFRTIGSSREVEANCIAALSLAPLLAWGIATGFPTQSPYMRKPSFPPLVADGKFLERKDMPAQAPGPIPKDAFKTRRP